MKITKKILKEIYGPKTDICGQGNYASISFCPPVVTLYRCKSLDNAKAGKRFIDEYGCGGGCMKKHEVVPLEYIVSFFVSKVRHIKQLGH